MKELSTADANGDYTVKYGVLFADNYLAGSLEAMAGTLRAAKRKKIIQFGPEILLQGAHDKEDVKLIGAKAP
jgi:hypothetical protein